MKNFKSYVALCIMLMAVVLFSTNCGGDDEPGAMEGPEQPRPAQPNVDITLNDGTSVSFTVGKVYVTDFNPGTPNTSLLVLADAASTIDLDGSNNLIGSGKNVKLFIQNASGNLDTEITNAAANNQYATYNLADLANGAVNYAFYEDGEAIESPAIVDGFAGQVFIGDKIGDEYYIYVNATDPNNPSASIFVSLRAALIEFVY